MRPDGIKSILIFDSCKHSTKILRDTLWMADVNDLGFARSIDEMREQLELKSWSCIVLDWDERGGTGLEIVKEIRGTKFMQNRKVPIVLCTANTDRASIERARDSGVNEVVAKPIVGGQLMKRVIAASVRRRPFVEEPAYTGPDRRRRAAEIPTKERRTEDHASKPKK